MLSCIFFYLFFYPIRLIEPPTSKMGGEMATLRSGKLPLVKFDSGNAYEGEWLNGNLHGQVACEMTSFEYEEKPECG